MLDLDPAIPADVPGLWDGYAAWLREKGVRHPRVVIHGGYGKNNLGDDAILDVLIERTLANLPGAIIRVVCHGPKNVRERYRNVAGLKAHHFKSAGAARAILRSHIYIIGGGGIVNRINVYSGNQRFKLLDMKGKFLFIAAQLAKLRGAQTHFYAIGATSFPDEGVKLLARVVLQGADVVSVRDERSIDNLRSIGVTRELVQVLDPALSMQPASSDEGARLLRSSGYQSNERPLVCIGFRYVRDEATDNDAKVESVVRLARHLIEDKDCDVVFVPASQHPSERFEDDLDFGRRVVRGVDRADRLFLVNRYEHPKVTMAAFGQADFCVFERLHACILTSVIGTPFFCISYDHKVTEFMRLIHRDHLRMDSADFALQTDYAWLDAHLDSALVRKKRTG